MKVWIISLGCLISFLIVGSLVQSSLERAADRLNHQLTKVERELVARDWEQSLRELDKLQKSWEKTKPYWAVLTNHKEMDLIEEALIKTIKAISSQSYADARIHLGLLHGFIKHIPEREKFSLVNVF